MQHNSKQAQEQKQELERLGRELDEWKLHPTTKAVRRWAKLYREGILAEWASGAFTREETGGTAQANAREIGRCMAMLDFLNLEPINLLEPRDE